MKSNMLSSDDFFKLGLSIIKRNNKYGSISRRRFRALFGVDSIICAQIWKLIYSKLPNGASPMHLMWTFMFLKAYNTEEVNSSFVGIDEKTYRKWVWICIDCIAKLRVVRNKLSYVLEYFTFKV